MAPSINASSTDLVQYVKSSLCIAAANARHPWHWPVLITSNQGRVVVLRGVDSEEGSWIFYTDLRTPKVQQLVVNANEATATFYHPKERAQLRLRGKVNQLDEAIHTRYWDMLDIGQKSSYGAFSAPGSVIESPSSGLSENWLKNQPTAKEEDEAFKNFAIFSFKIEEVELLLLLRDGHRRSSWEGWGGDNFKWLIP